MKGLIEMTTTMISRKAATAIALIAGAAIALSGCTTASQAQVVPSAGGPQVPVATATASAAPVEIPVAQDNGFGFDASSVVIPAEVTAVFGDASTSLVQDALSIIHSGYSENPQFMVAGWSQADYDLTWTAFSQAYLTDAITSEAVTAAKKDSFVPAIPVSGVLGVIGGVTYTMPSSADGGGVTYTLTTTPVVTLATSGDAAVIGFDLTETFNTVPAHATAGVHISLTMIPLTDASGAVQWKITGYAITQDDATVVKEG